MLALGPWSPTPRPELGFVALAAAVEVKASRSPKLRAQLTARQHTYPR